MIQRTFRGDLRESETAPLWDDGLGHRARLQAARKKLKDFYVWVGTPIRGRTIFFASPGPGSAGEWWRGSILRGIPDELVQSLDLGLLLLRAYDPPNGRPSIGGRLLLEELPPLLVRLEP